MLCDCQLPRFPANFPTRTCCYSSRRRQSWRWHDLSQNRPIPVSSSWEKHAEQPTTALASATASEGEWTKKRLHNTQWFRSATILLTICAAGATQQSPLAQIPSRFGVTINLFSFGMSFGTMFYTTFIFGITAFKNLPRQTFGKLQSKLFPKYFSLCSAAILFQVRREAC